MKAAPRIVMARIIRHRDDRCMCTFHGSLQAINALQAVSAADIESVGHPRRRGTAATTQPRLQVTFRRSAPARHGRFRTLRLTSPGRARRRPRHLATIHEARQARHRRQSGIVWPSRQYLTSHGRHAAQTSTQSEGRSSTRWISRSTARTRSSYNRGDISSCDANEERPRSTPAAPRRSAASRNGERPAAACSALHDGSCARTLTQRHPDRNPAARSTRTRSGLIVPAKPLLVAAL